MQYLGWTCVRAGRFSSTAWGMSLGGGWSLPWGWPGMGTGTLCCCPASSWEHSSTAFANGRGLRCLHSTVPHTPPCASVRQSPLCCSSAVQGQLCWKRADDSARSLTLFYLVCDRHRA